MRATRERVTIVCFEVEGDGPFPYDMLRYDRAWPMESVDATGLGQDMDYSAGRKRRIKLQMCAREGQRAAPTTERWGSFGWRVTRVGEGH